MEFRILFIYTSLWTWAFLVLKIAGSLNSPSIYQENNAPSLSQKYGVVQFTETFNLNSWATYEQFIQSLRDKGQLRYKTSHGRPVLYPEDQVVTKFFDVILKADNSEVTFRIRQENLYLIGYKNANNQWLEFDSSSHLITGSTFLGFDGSYDSLKKKAGNRDSIALGKVQLKTAVSDLATSTDITKRAKGLTIVIQMISESMRFRSMSTFLTSKSGNPGNPPLRLIELQTSWGHISEELLHRDSDPTYKFKPPNAQTEITNEVEAVEAIGMIKYFKFPQISGWNMEANNEGEYPQANPMVEVA